MKILNNNKKVYSTPQIECVKLDNEISLAMESAPTPDSGDEVMNKLPEGMNNDPFKNNLA